MLSQFFYSCSNFLVYFLLLCLKIAAKLSISLLRHSDIIPADKAFYEAGINCREQGWTSMAFVFLNRYLDLVEAIEDPKNLASALDSSDLQETDIPLEVPLPEEAYTNQEEHESVREWILAVSMDHKLEQSLPCDERGIYVAALSTPKSQGPTALPCLITGYPILQPAGEIRFQNSNRVANRRDWNSFEAACRAARTAECIDTMDFLKRWCGSAVNADVAVKF
ncbi:unnamed protein product [Protopolystoma xenopodis]|uniref:Intraflagellar transport protein 172 homolog n=1 Tax=Protopolystoma xenopodis TaxID=117903 RepID=A0A3S5B900_9PLAT|nr:unnamed protein product [Protopolystoma xenopodis]